MSGLEKVSEGLLIFKKYDTENEGGLNCDHDELFVCVETAPEQMSSEDTSRLKELGFNWDESLPGWRRFTSC